MTYLFPILYVAVSYIFPFLPRLFGYTADVEMITALLPFVMGIINLIVVLTVGRKWSKETLLNCALIVKYGLIPFFMAGGYITVCVTAMAFFPLPLMALFGLATVLLVFFGYGILLGSAPYAIAYIIKAYKEGTHSKPALIISGICQFLFCFDVLSIMILALKERRFFKTTIFLLCALALCVLLAILFLCILFVLA